MSDLSKYRAGLRDITKLAPPPGESISSENQEIDIRLLKLRMWQSQRLARTYTDLLNSVRYAQACGFFLTDIYASQNFMQRDANLKHLYEYMSRVLPEFALSLAKKAIDLNDLTSQLDMDLAEALFAKNIYPGKIDTITYAEGYRACDNYSIRAQQIQMIYDVGMGVHTSTRLPFIGTALKLARIPARKVGWMVVQDFLERGFTSFRTMGRAEGFLSTIYSREMDILDKIFTEHKDPFGFELSLDL